MCHNHVRDIIPSNLNYKEIENVPPDTFPVEAIDSTKTSRAGNGDFPEKYELGNSFL